MSLETSGHVQLEKHDLKRYDIETQSERLIKKR